MLLKTVGAGSAKMPTEIVVSATAKLPRPVISRTSICRTSRRFRDAYLYWQYKVGGLSNGDDPLDGSAEHSKKDMADLFGYVSFQPNLLYGDYAYPLWGDFNGDGWVSLEDRMPVAGLAPQAGMMLDDNGTPYLTDLEVFTYTARQQGVWQDEFYELEDLLGLVESGDIEVWPRSCASLSEIDFLTSEVVGQGEVREHIVNGEERTPRTIFTLQPGTYTLKVTALLKFNVETTSPPILAMSVTTSYSPQHKTLEVTKDFVVEPGSDAFWDPPCADVRAFAKGVPLTNDNETIELYQLFGRGAHES